MNLVDTHAHLDFRQFDADREAVIERARAAGVAAIVNVGTDLASSRRAVALAAEHEQIYAAVGMHPHDAKRLDGAALAELRDAGPAAQGGGRGRDRAGLLPGPIAPRRAAAGLSGSTWLGRQTGQAGHHPRPRCPRRDHGHPDRLGTGAAGFSALAGRLGVLHTFSGDRAMAEKAIELGFYISISGPVTYKNAHRLAEIVQALPLDRLLVETDCPFLTPHPHRGKRNEPAYVRLVAERIAALRGMSFDDLAEATTANAQRLFQFELRPSMSQEECQSTDIEHRTPYIEPRTSNWEKK